MSDDQATRIAKSLAAHREGLLRSELIESLGISEATLQRGLALLRGHGWVDPPPEQPGRRLSQPLFLTERAGLLAGADIGRGHLHVVITDAHRRPLGGTVTRDVDLLAQGNGVLNDVVDALQEAVEKANQARPDRPVALRDIAVFGFGVPTAVDGAGNVLGTSVWRGLHLTDNLASLIKTKAKDTNAPFDEQADPVVVAARDAEVGALAAWLETQMWRDTPDGQPENGLGPEYRGDSTQRAVMLYLKASHGIDAGLICEGSLLRGAHDLGLQVGHMLVPNLEPIWKGLGDPPPRSPCPECGRDSCLENVASAHALVDGLQAAAASGAQLAAPQTVSQLIDQVVTQQTDRPKSYEAVAEAGALTGKVLAEAALVSDPGVIVVGGLLAKTGNAFLVPLRQAFASALQTWVTTDIRGVQPDRVETIELQGALALAQQNLAFRLPD
jgi:hypothetical protein